MISESKRPIIIKRIRKAGSGHHGGMWKVAYADFVTAMMAFFLLMWLLGSTTRNDLQGVAGYFQTPLKVALSGGPSASAQSSPIQAAGQKPPGSEAAQRQPSVGLREAQAELRQQEKIRLEALKQRIEKVIEANPLLREYRNQLLLDITPEGLRIQIVDQQNRPMFDNGSDQLKPYAKAILLALARTLNEVDNGLSLSGHTDAALYARGDRGYSNWELSADRANASRRVLTEGGIEDGKIRRVVGMSSSSMLDSKNPLNPANRRISIIVLNHETEESLRTADGPTARPPAESGAGPKSGGGVQ